MGWKMSGCEMKKDRKVVMVWSTAFLPLPHPVTSLLLLFSIIIRVPQTS